MSWKPATLGASQLPHAVSNLDQRRDRWVAGACRVGRSASLQQTVWSPSSKAIRASYGFNRLSKLGGSNCMMFDEAGCPGQANATVPLSELIPTSDNEQIVIMDLFDMNKGEHDLLTDLSKAYELPEFLDALSNVRLLSLGGRPEGVQMSKHHSAWLGRRGRKAVASRAAGCAAAERPLLRRSRADRLQARKA